MSEKSRGSLEKVILAGIGAMATTAEKSKEMLDELVKKGELTVEQGKALNEELKHTVKNTISEASKPVHEFIASEVVKNLDKLTPDELAQIRAKLQELEESGGEKEEAEN